jgi:hypothetical protein
MPPNRPSKRDDQLDRVSPTDDAREISELQSMSANAIGVVNQCWSGRPPLKTLVIAELLEGKSAPPGSQREAALAGGYRGPSWSPQDDYHRD